MTSRLVAAVVLLLVVGVAVAEVHFEENFDDKSKWVISSWKGSGQAGKWDLSAGDWYGDKQADQGLRTTEDARFYGISAKLAKPFTNKGRDLIFQFNIKHPQNIDCGGGYIKLAAADVAQADFGGPSPYYIMFGSDICGGTRKTHAIFNYKGKNLENKKNIRCETDQLSHLYTLIVHPDNTYEVQIDQKRVEGGKLEDDYDFLPPKTIKDPAVSKPSDWVDEAKIDDPTDFKPAGWDDIPAKIVDPDASKPTTWDDVEDGEWEAPLIDNPEYQGEWKARVIDNPDYKGEWEHPMIANPEYVADENLYLYENIGLVGIELWQVKSGTIFDNIVVTDDINYAKSVAAKTWKKSQTKEKEMFDAIQDAKRKADDEARKAAEEANASSSEEPSAEDVHIETADADDDAKAEARKAKLAELKAKAANIDHSEN
eukprot:gnl/Hemi2/5954_TR2070_c0_g1_i1.p1 gnl/Hemi2/5954_TR2070_c0_g1~~gnl/Hemi2/5954_TR2070_c0_g1_i1.p1  ORF type:complete len:428 (-),score=229.32 gnl/Hemi2/5954_TR2070_c0_g1_i1:328-1611(-)